MNSQIPKIIAVCGMKQSGKDTVVNYIIDQSKYKYNHRKIAWPLKKMISDLFGFSLDDMENKKEVPSSIYNESPRKLMDFFGTHIFQHELQKIIPDIGRSFWIKKLLCENVNKNIIISDLRFLHEEAELKKHNSLIIKVFRNDTTDDGLDSELEHCNIKPDVEIYNNTNDIQSAFKNTLELFYHKFK